ncbi:MAG: outer membrane protein assembly factor BamA, partial [Pseudomonadota bacterium]
LRVTLGEAARYLGQRRLNFIRVEPRVRRNDAALTLDVEFFITRGPRVFVERIDVEGNSTTLDRVVRREFRIAEGDPFNPRQIRAAAERIRALNFFSNVEVNAREGSAPDQVVIDVDVEEAPTGSLGFGANYSIEDGLGFAVTFNERNFLGRGQFIGLTFNSSPDNQEYTFNFREPKLLGRDLAFGFLASYRETSGVNDADFDTQTIVLSPSVAFPLSENGRLQLRYRVSQEEISDVSADSSRILAAEEGQELRSEIGYTYSYDTRRTGLNPAAGVLLQFSQDIAGFGGDSQYVRTTARALAERRVAREEVTLRAAVEGGALNMLDDGASRITDRFRISSRQFRGFSGGGIGPRDLNAANRDALGGNYYAVARFEAEFPLGLPEEYGVRGGAFFDIGSLWDLDNAQGGPQGPFVAGNEIDDSFHLRSTVGVSLFFDSALGPLRFNFSHPLEKQSYDRTRSFDFTISTRF